MKNVRKFKRKRFPFLKKLILVALLVAVGYFLMFDTFRVTKINVEGSERYTEDEIRDYLITDTLDHNSLYLLLKYKYGDKPVIPFVQDFDIELVNKNTIEIHIYEKVVTGCVEFLGEYMYFDKDGIVVETSSEKEENIPQIVGLSYTRIALHEQIQIQKQSLFNTILNLTKLIRQYQIDVDTITFDSDYEVTLTCGNSKVLLGKHDFYDVPLSQLNNILAASEGVAYSYDMRNYTKAGQKFIVKKLE